MRPGDAVLMLVDYGSASPSEYLALLRAADQADCPVAVIPTAARPRFAEILASDELVLDLRDSAFRLLECPETVDAAVPAILRRGQVATADGAGEDLRRGSILALQGHGGPADAGFGPFMNLCSRGLYDASDQPTFPCYGTTRCFRQALYARADADTAGLIDPRDVKASLVILDGCGTLPVPGSLFPFATSLARGLLESRARALVLSHGVSASPLSAYVLLLALLAESAPLGVAVRAANRHRRVSAGTASIVGDGVAPWILVGNPIARVRGLHVNVLEPVAGAPQDFVCETPPGPTGALVRVPERSDGPAEVVTDPPCWVAGARFEGFGYLWLGHTESSSVVHARIKPRSIDPATWLRRQRQARGAATFLRGLAGAVARAGADASVMRTLADLWLAVEESAEPLVLSVIDAQVDVIADSIAGPMELSQHVETLDRVSAMAIAQAAATTGARLYRFWSPPWPSGHLTEGPTCSCGALTVMELRRHPGLQLARFNVRCPGCGPIGDVAAVPDTSGAPVPVVHCVPSRLVEVGSTLEWRLHFNDQARPGTACATVFDAFRRSRLCTASVRYGGDGRVLTLHAELPPEWPIGLSQAVVVICSEGQISLIDYDLVVRREPSRRLTIGGATA